MKGDPMKADAHPSTGVISQGLQEGGRTPAFEAVGRGFESLRARQVLLGPTRRHR
jgi:hypothetical protein